MKHFIINCWVAFCYCMVFATLVAAAILMIRVVFIPIFTHEF